MREEVSAGGIVFWQDRVLILRNFRGEYVFPKGHLEAGETATQAALREVAEEAGLQARIVAAAPDTAYSFRRPDGRLQPKRVHWFVMTTESDSLQVDGAEIEWGAFLLPTEVSALLTHQLDKNLLQQVLEMGGGNPSREAASENGSEAPS
ncbi:MAG: NUDIX hydrolase [Bacillota bacterium]|jgi:8-oxo-dGTP pyrophosphatase MutT (NUDIX family)